MRGGRLDAYGTTVFAEMSTRAALLGAVNLGQGFPEEPGPNEVLEAALAAISEGRNQYAPGRGVAELRSAIADHASLYYGQVIDPDSEVLVTAGATEAIAATILALCGPGDEVVAFEPLYDSYAATVDLSGAALRTVRLEPPGWSFDPEELKDAVGERTRVILLNSPHNPTGRVFSHAELELIAELCCERDVIAVSDEVYEHLVFKDGHRHERLACFPDMRDRTVSISSAGKTFSVTGWKIGWLLSAPPLVASITAVKQFLTFTNGTPFQYGVATGLRLPPARIEKVAADLELRRDLFCGGLRRLGWEVATPEATYFCSLDATQLGRSYGKAFCLELLERVGVAAIPMSSFYVGDAGTAGSFVRFAFCKSEALLEQALERLSGW